MSVSNKVLNREARNSIFGHDWRVPFEIKSSNRNKVTLGQEGITIKMIMLFHLTRVNDVMCFKHISFLFLVQKKRLEVNVGEK